MAAPITYTPVGDLLIDQLVEPPPQPGQFRRGLKTGVADLKSIGGGVLQYAGRGLGAKPLEDYGAGVVESAAAEAAPYRMQVEDVGAAFDQGVGPGLGAAADLVKYTVGNQLPMLATTVAGGVGGRLAAGALGATRAAAGVSAAEKAAAVAKTAAGVATPGEAAIASAVKAADLGTGLGLGASAVGMELGQIAPEGLKPENNASMLQMATGALAAGVLDTMVPVYLARQMGLMGVAQRALTPRAAGIGAVAKDVGVGAAKVGAFEAGQETAQSVIERASANQPLSGPEAGSDYLNSGVMGAIMGVLTGGIGGGVNSMQRPVAGAQPVVAPPTEPEAPAGPVEPAPAPPTPEALHADLVAQHAAATEQLTSLGQAVTQAQQQHDALVAARAQLDNESKLEPGQRRTKSELTVAKRAATAQIKAARAQIEELGGQVFAARNMVDALTPQIETARQALTPQGDTNGLQIEGQAPAQEVTPLTFPTIDYPGTPTPYERTGTVPDLVQPEIAARAAPLGSDTIADPNLPAPAEAEQVDRAVKGVHALFREQRMPLTTTEESLATPPLTRREVALARVEQRAPREAVKNEAAAQMAAVEENAMAVIEPLAATMAATKTKTPKGQAKVAAKFAKAMRGVVQEAAKTGSIEAAQQYVTKNLPTALKGLGVTADAVDMAKAVNAGVGLARTQFSKGATEDYAANLAFYLQEKTGSVLGKWRGKMSASEQRKLFGRFIGKGDIIIDGQMETVANRVRVAFGQDYDDRNVTSWRDLNLPTQAPSESRAALTQDEFEALPAPAKTAALDAYTQAMRAKGTALLARLLGLIGDRPELTVSTFAASPGGHIGSYTRVGPLKAVISMATNAKEGLSVADHEGYHFAEDWLLTGGEKKVVANALRDGKPLFEQLKQRLRQYDRENGTNLTDEVTGIPAEARAYTFEFWRRGEFKAEGALARAWQKIKQFFERVANAVKGLGFQSIEDVFVALAHGQMAQREMVAPEGRAAYESRAADYLQSPAFKKWFGDSKAVDAEGKPLVVYHGTNKEFHVFQTAAGARSKMVGDWDGVHFTNDRAQAQDIANSLVRREGGEPRVVAVYLRAENPALFGKFKTKEQAQAAGHDSRLTENNTGLQEWTVFEPTQIKSVNNIGTFDPNNPDIRFSGARGNSWYYSALTDAVAAMPTKQASAQGWRDQIKGLVAKGAVKQVELDAVGLNEWLDLQAGMPIHEPGFAVIEEWKEGSGPWEQVDDLGMYSRTAAEAEQKIAGLGAVRGEDGVQARYVVKALPGIDFGKKGSGKITKDQVMAFLGEHGVQVQDVVLGERSSLRIETDGQGEFNVIDNVTEEILSVGNSYPQAEAYLERHNDKYTADIKFSGYQLPGGTNYRELLLTLPDARLDEYERIRSKRAGGRVLTQDEVDILRNPPDVNNEFRSSHYDQPNILAHVRFNERVDAGGRRVLFIEEIQSDWAQKGRRVGFTDENAIKEAKAKAQAMRGEWEDANTKLDAAKVEVRKYAKAALAKMGLDSYQQIITAGAKRAELTLRFRDLQKEPAYARAIREEDRLNTIAGDLATRMGEYERGHGQDNTVPNAPFVSTNKFAVFKDGKEVTRTDKDGKEHQERYSSMKDAEAAAVKKGGEARDLGMQEDTQAWTALALKRMIRYAAENGFDRVAWTTGAQQAERYDLSKQVDYIDYIREGPDTFRMAIVGKNGEGINLPQETFTAKELEDYVGKGVAQQIVEGEGQPGGGRMTLRGPDLRIGGEGMKGYYDKIVPSVANEILRKLGGGKVGEISVALNTPTTTKGMTRVVRDDDGTYAVEVRRFDDNDESFWEPAAYGLTKEDAEARRLFEGEVPVMQQPGFDVTPRLAEAAANGLPLFSRAAAEMHNRMAAGELEAVQIGEQYARLVENAKAPSDLLTRLLGVAKDDIVGGIGRWWTNNVSTPNFISASSRGFKNVYQAFNTYSRYRKILGEQLVRERVPDWYRASDADRKAAFDVMLTRTLEKYSTSSQELADLLNTLTPAQRKLYDQATGMIAAVLRRQFDSQKETRRRQLGAEAYEKWLASRQEQMTALLDQGYVPLRRYGDYSVEVYMEAPDGKRVKAGLEFFNSPSQAKTAALAYAKEIERSGVALKVEMGRRSKNERDTGVSLEQFLGTLRRQGIDISQAERERLVVAMTNADSLVRTQMMRREGLAGFSRDSMRVLHEFGVNTTSEIAYARFAPVLDAALDGAEVAADIDAVTSEPVITVGESFGRREDGVPHNLWEQDGPMSGFYRDRANAMADTTLVPDRQSEWATKMRTAGVMYFIGGSISGAAVNTLSIPMVLTPYLSTHTDYLNATMTSLKTWKDSWQHYNVLRDMDKMKNPDPETAARLDAAGIGKEMRAAIVAAADHIFDTEIHMMLGISQGSLYSRSRNVQRAAEVWMTPFRVAEQTNRLASFMAAYRIATTGGGVRQADGTFKKLSGQELFRFASETVDQTQNNYNVNNRPGIMNNPLGALMFQFKSFPLFIIEAAALMYKVSPKSAVYMLLGLTAMAGVQGLPFAEEILNLVDVISQQLFNSPFNSRRAMRNAIKSASDAIGAADLSDAVMRGLVNEVTGVGVATRVSSGFIPGTRVGAADADKGRVLAEIAGAPFSMLHDALSNAGPLVSAAAGGDWRRAADALRAGGPIAARNLVKGAEQLSSGYASDSKGRKVVDVSTVDGILQLTGLSSAAVTKANDMESIIIQTKAFHTQVSQDLEARLVKAYRADDAEQVARILDLRAKWNAQNPMMPILSNPAATRRAIMLAGMPLNRREQILLGRRLGAEFADVTAQ